MTRPRSMERTALEDSTSTSPDCVPTRTECLRNRTACITREQRPAGLNAPPLGLRWHCAEVEHPPRGAARGPLRTCRLPMRILGVRPDLTPSPLDRNAVGSTPNATRVGGDLGGGVDAPRNVGMDGIRSGRAWGQNQLVTGDPRASHPIPRARCPPQIG